MQVRDLKRDQFLLRLTSLQILSECDLFCASYNISFKGFHFEGNFKPEVLFMQVDDEVFDERLENLSESSARARQTKDRNKHRKHG